MTYNAGVQPFDSAGNPYDSSLAAGTTGSLSTSLEGVYPLYGTTIDISINSPQSLVSMLTENNIVFAMVPETDGYKQSFDIANAWIGSPTNRSIGDIETFNTVSNTWDSTGLSQWDSSAITHSIQSNTVNYTRYTYNGPNRSSIQIRLVF